ncbi:armadillo-type protein [Mycena floridula]|nr:armadillo-type protein [Mycena floridula]
MAGVSSKKRSAASQAGPNPKKAHLEQPKKAPKRSRPVTAAVEPDSDSEDSDDGQDEFEDIEEEEDQVEETMDVDIDETTHPLAAKDPNAAREGHKAQKALLEQRRAARPHSSLIADAKQMWGLARQKSIPVSERQKHVRDLMDVIRGKVKDIVFKREASRIVQTVVKYGGQKERDEIAVELKGSYLQLVQNKYSKFLVTKLIRLCPSHRAAILGEFQGNVLRLLLNRAAASVLADTFELYANAYERTILLRDFYGKETSLFSVTKGSEVEKEQAKRGLSGILEGVDKERRKRILTSMKESLVTIFNNPDKNAIVHAIVHRALWEYMTAISDDSNDAEREKNRREIFDNCQELLAEMVHTKDGSRVVRDFLANGTAKDRKQILKVLKPHVLKMCKDDEPQLVLFTALDVIDDTKLLLKTIVPEMTSSAPDLYSTPQGRRSILYLLVPRTRRHFTPAQIVALAETDEARSRTSKKAPEARQNEIRVGASEALLQWVQSKGDALIRDPAGSLVVAEVMLFADGDKSAAISTLLQSVSSPYPSSNPASPHPIDLPHTSRLYKTLLQGGHFNHTSKTVELAPPWDRLAFAAQFVDTLDQDILTSLCTKGEKNGAFVIAELCQALVGAAEVTEARQKVKRSFSESVLKDIDGGSGKGRQVLLEKIALL